MPLRWVGICICIYIYIYIRQSILVAVTCIYFPIYPLLVYPFSYLSIVWYSLTCSDVGRVREIRMDREAWAGATFEISLSIFNVGLLDDDRAVGLSKKEKINIWQTFSFLQ